jgi:hypothetical protein
MDQSYLDLSGKVALSPCQQGYGKAIALAFADAGADWLSPQ